MKIKFSIPEHINEISLKAYQDFAKLTEGGDNYFLNQAMIAKFCDLRISDVLVMKRKDVVEIANDLNKLFEPKNELQRTFKVGDIEFGFIPNLEDMSFGEFVDLEKYISSWDTMHKAMAVMYRPITRKIKDQYIIKDYEGTDATAELMKQSPLGIAMGAQVFFYTLAKDLGRAMQLSLAEELLEESLDLPNSLTRIGDGITQYTQSLKETCLDLMMSQDSQ